MPNTFMKQKMVCVVLCFISVLSRAQQINIDSFLNARKVMKASATGKAYAALPSLSKYSGLTADEIKSKVVFINFWFAGCSPCMAEMPALNDLYKRLRKRKDFLFLSVTFDSPADIQKSNNAHSLAFSSLSVPHDEILQMNFRNGYPFSILLDKNAIVSDMFWESDGKISGAELIKNRILPAIESLLFR